MTSKYSLISLRTDNFSTLMEELQRTAEALMIRHERPGAVHISASDAIIHISSVHLATVTVRDTGRGMSKEQLNAITAFQQFQRQYYEQQGAGLGLVIAKSLVELYGGKFEIASSEKKGTTVRLTFRIVEKD